MLRSVSNGIWSLYLYPQAVVDLADLVEAYAAKWVVLFKAGVYRDVEVTCARALTLAEIAAEVGVSHQVFDANVLSIATIELLPWLNEVASTPSLHVPRRFTQTRRRNHKGPH